jgi:hypothetical protein
LNGAAENYVSSDLAHRRYDRDKDGVVTFPINGDSEAANPDLRMRAELDPFVAFLNG